MLLTALVAGHTSAVHQDRIATPARCAGARRRAVERYAKLGCAARAQSVAIPPTAKLSSYSAPRKPTGGAAVRPARPAARGPLVEQSACSRWRPRPLCAQTALPRSVRAGGHRLPPRQRRLPVHIRGTTTYTHVNHKSNITTSRQLAYQQERRRSSWRARRGQSRRPRPRGACAEARCRPCRRRSAGAERRFALPAHRAGLCRRQPSRVLHIWSATHFGR